MINYDLKKIRAIIFDVDGVLSAETIPLPAVNPMDSDDGQPMRTVNIKDGYAIQLALKMGIHLAIITGGMKIKTYDEFKEKYNLKDDEVIYMGDDIPDIQIMQIVGCPCCPADACAEVKEISVYVSHKNGGYGCARDVIEQVLKAQGLWMADAKAFGW